QHPGLGDVVGAHFRRCTKSGGGSDIDDATIAKFPKFRREVMAAVDYAPKIHVHAPVPVIQWHLADGPAEPHACSVDNQCHRTAPQLLGLITECFHLLRITDVTAPGNCLAAQRLQACGDLLGSLLIDVCTDNRATTTCQLVGKAATNAAACSGDDSGCIT